MKKTDTGRLFLVLAFVALAACGREQPAPAEEPVTEEVVSEEAVGDEAPADSISEAPDQAASQAVTEEADQAVSPDVTEEADQAANQDDSEESGQAPSYRFQEGTHYVRLAPPQPTVGGADRIEVAEIFWYGCPHCSDIDPVFNRWAAVAPAEVRFVRIPATYNRAAETHAQLFYTLEVLVMNGVIADGDAIHSAVFNEYHNRGNYLNREDSIRSFFVRFGVDAAEFDRVWNSFEVAQKLAVARDLARRYRIDSVPMVVVNGKYRTSGALAGPDLFSVIDELIAREASR